MPLSETEEFPIRNWGIFLPILGISYWQNTVQTFAGGEEASLEVSQLLPELLFPFSVSADTVPLPHTVLLLPLCLDAYVRKIVDDVFIWKVGIDTCTFQAGLLGDLSHSQTLGMKFLNLTAQ
ncbi:hypothetical protein [Chordicoccus furentiruminis]|uniref:hypothetical protein n=1 Tax=Chordicoccus furentiruminis TaxID=2709410 RepID=UPI0023A906B2|nr:hypothetical protein [Chordicoccus furentiruminis]